MDHELSLSNEDSTVDYKVTKRHFPRTNNESCLEFIFEKDPNLFLRKNKILIKGAIEIDQGYIPENGFAAKLFSMMSVEIDSQTVSKNYNKYEFITKHFYYFNFRGEFFLADYIYKVGNFNTSMLITALSHEGYFDYFNSDKKEISKQQSANIINRRKFGSHPSGTIRRFEFIFCPMIGFLASPDLLMKDCELKISFDRANAANAILEYDTVTNACTGIEIKDCYAVTEYVSSPSLRNHFEQIDTSPLVYEYDDCEILMKSIPLHDTDIRFDTIRGGNIPDYIFAAVVPQSSLNGDFEKSTTYFHRHKVNS